MVLRWRAILACSFMLVGSVWADDTRSPLIATSLMEVDDDFHFQGEFFGPAPAGVAANGLLGLQVVALGEHKFDGFLLPGGLPGAGWDRLSRWKHSGARAGESLQLAGSDYQLSVSPDEAVVMNLSGTEVARLPRIHRVSATAGAAPPWNATVLFDGTSTAQFEGGRITDEGLLDVGALTRLKVGDFHMHVEFRTPYMPGARGQGRGNSGVYIQQSYEVQILDSFGLDGVENECGGLYRQQRPDVNMCLPPLSWQTYDIYFTAARFDCYGNKIANARITVLHNGEAIHDHYEIIAKTGAGKPESPEWRPILFQNHRDPVRFRNIWIVATSSECVTPPVCPAPRRLRWHH